MTHEAPLSFQRERQKARRCAEPLATADKHIRESGVDIETEVISTAIGVVVGRVVEQALFG